MLHMLLLIVGVNHTSCVMEIRYVGIRPATGHSHLSIP